MTEAVTSVPAAAPGESTWEARPARTEDVPSVAAAVAALLEELGGTPPAREALETEAAAHLADPSLGLILVAAAPPPEARSRLAGNGQENCERAPGGEGLVGVLAASWARAIQVAGRLLTIEVLWTRREWRDEGVGAALVEALAGAAAAEGAGRVEVGLPREGFPALRATERFYLANGFERLGPRMRRPLR
jgi:GNAT superfamily N-acetyltransferase